ncbi:MAG TPA: hypothetical protein VNP04_03320 [Alphaproteobacteria bacterium]|nr:hypothetical protein [Alphaproteobacteria bacterium]
MLLGQTITAVCAQGLHGLGRLLSDGALADLLSAVAAEGVLDR